MRRRTFDVIASWVGVFLVVLLVIAGGLLWWAYSFVDDEVSTQLTAQQIVFPEAGSESLQALPPDDRAEMEKYAGQTMSTGAQAKTYADHYIAVHLADIGGGKTYSELSAQALTQPDNTQLAGQVEAMFKGETLRGLLLNAYAFWQMGQIAKIGAIVAWAGALVMLVLAVLGFMHERRVSENEELMPPHPDHSPA